MSAEGKLVRRMVTTCTSQKQLERHKQRQDQKSTDLTPNAKKFDENNETFGRPTNSERTSSRSRGRECGPSTAHPSQKRQERYHREYKTAEKTLAGTIPTATDVEKFFHKRPHRLRAPGERSTSQSTRTS